MKILLDACALSFEIQRSEEVNKGIVLPAATERISKHLCMM